MSFTLILAVTAAVAGSMGYLAARKKSDEPEAPPPKRKNEKKNEHDEQDEEEKDEYGKPPPAVDWDSHWLRWPDFRLPSDRAEARKVFVDALERAGTERVEFACGGGRGRTGTALACLAVLDGIPADEAVDYVRRTYDGHAVETLGQKRFVGRFTR